MRDYTTTTGCPLEYLRRQLDDPYARACGRCDTCRGQWLDGFVPEEALARARAYLARPGVAVAPRRMWPTGMRALGVEVSGRIPPDELAEPGRAVGRLTDLGWGARLRDLLANGDIEVPDDVFAAVVAVLREWDWARRPVAVAAVSSRTHSGLVGSLARRVARAGRLADLGNLPWIGSGPPGAASRSNSAQRLAAVWDAFAVPDPTARALAALAGPVLLVDDVIDSGWTMTTAVRALRLAGADAVLPLALASAG